MNPIINNRYDNGISIHQNKNGSASVNLQEGSVLQAKITAKDDKKTTFLADIDGSPFTFTGNNKDVFGKVGDTAFFKVAHKNGKMALSQIEEPAISHDMKVFEKLDEHNWKDLQKDESLLERTKEFLGLTDEEMEMREASKKIKRQLKYGLENIGENVFKSFLSSGVPMESLSLTKMNQVISGALKDYPLGDNTESQEVIENFLEQVKELEPFERANIIESEKPLTLENVYVEKHQGSHKENKLEESLPIYKEGIDRENEIKKFLEAEGIEVTDENINHAKELWDYENEISKENMDTLEQLLSIDTVDKDDVVNRAMDLAKDGTNPMEVMLFDVRESKKTAEIQDKMLEEAAQKLTGKLDVDTEKTKERLETLKVKEAKLVEALEMANTAVSEENLETMAEIRDARESLYTPNYKVYESLATDTLEELASINRQGQSIASQEKVAEYDVFSAVVNPRYGDSLSQAFKSIDGILEAQGIEVSLRNKRAAEILAVNQMEINEENILDIKQMDMKLSQVLDNLTPLQVADMLQEQKNPLEMTLDDLIEQTDTSLLHEYEEYTRDDIASAIYEMDKKGEFSKETKEHVINVYKMLNQVNTHYGAMSFALIQGKEEPTLRELMENVHHTATARKGLDTAVDKDTGALANKEEYAKQTVNQIERYMDGVAAGETIEKVGVDVPADDWSFELKDNYLKRLDDIEVEAQELFKTSMAEYNALPSEVFAYAAKHSIPVTMGHLKTLSTFVMDDRYFAEESEELELDGVDIEELADSEDIEEAFTKWNESVNEAYVKADEPEKIKAVDRLKKAMALQFSMRGKTNSIRMPVSVGGSLADMHLFVLSKEEMLESNKVFMKLNIRDKGDISVYIQRDKEGSHITFDTEDKKLQRELNQNIEEVSERDVPKRLQFHILGDGELDTSLPRTVAGILSYLENF